jgi:hypothetical protein
MADTTLDPPGGPGNARLSRADLHRAIETCLRDPVMAAWSDRKIARHVGGISHHTVAAARGRLGKLPTEGRAVPAKRKAVKLPTLTMAGPFLPGRPMPMEALAALIHDQVSTETRRRLVRLLAADLAADERQDRLESEVRSKRATLGREAQLARARRAAAKAGRAAAKSREG